MVKRRNSELSWRLPLALMITTLVTLGVELNFTRLISLLFMGKDAYWVIALALLGFGIGGAIVAVGGGWFASRVEQLLPCLMPGIGLAAVLPILLFRHLRPGLVTDLHPENPLLTFSWVSLAFLPAFLLSSTFISLVFMRHREIIGRFYFFDLLGAGLGCAVFVVCLRLFGVEYSLVFMAGLVTAASLLLIPRFSALSAAIFATASLVVLGVGLLIRGPSPLVPFIARELRMLYEYQGERVKLEFQKWDPVARIDVASVPGHVLRLPDPARYKLLTQDGGAPSILLSFDRPIPELEFPERSILGIAYWVRKAESVLIIGPGGGPDVVAALRYGPRKLTAVELNQTTIEVVRDHFSDFTGDIYHRPGVEVVNDDGRHFVRSSDERYDVIQLTGVDTTVLTAGGNLSENYLYTLEAFDDYWEHLTPDGLLSLSYPHSLRWGARALAMLMKLMHQRGTVEPERHLFISIGGGYINLLLKRSAFTRQEVAAVSRRFERPMYGLLLPLYYELWGQYLPENSFSLYVNRAFFEQQGILYDPFHARRNVYDSWVRSWLSAPDSEKFWKELADLRPARDDRPFFFSPILVGEHFAKRILWVSIPTLVFIIAPLAVFRRKGMAVKGAGPLAVYFGCLGFAFIAMEMVFLQKFVLFLGHPALSFAVVLGVLLVAAGVGSLVSGRVAARPLHGVLAGVGGVAVCTLAFVLLSDPLTRVLFRAPLAVRAALVTALITPLALSMGMLFPSGIRLLRSRSQEFVPWAWGINGSASVIGTLVSLLLAIQMGFSRLMLLAVVVYVLAAVAAVFAARQQSPSVSPGASGRASR